MFSWGSRIQLFSSLPASFFFFRPQIHPTRCATTKVTFLLSDQAYILEVILISLSSSYITTPYGFHHDLS